MHYFVTSGPLQYVHFYMTIHVLFMCIFHECWIIYMRFFHECGTIFYEVWIDSSIGKPCKPSMKSGLILVQVSHVSQFLVTDTAPGDLFLYSDIQHSRRSEFVL